MVTAAEYTPDDLMRLPDGDHCELVDGRFLEKRSGGELAFVAGQISSQLSQFASERGGGWVLDTTAGYHCFPHRPLLLRRPNVSYIRPGRLPNERMPRGDILLAPDLAVEVVSPNDLYTEVDIKVSEYLQAGVPLVWVVNPETRTAMAYHPDGSARRLREEDELDGGDVLPGFRCRLGDIFPPPVVEPQPPNL